MTSSEWDAKESIAEFELQRIARDVSASVDMTKVRAGLAVFGRSAAGEVGVEAAIGSDWMFARMK